MSSENAILIMKWLNFYLLFYLIFKFGKQPLLKLLDNSSNEIKNSLEEARQTKNDSTLLLKEYVEKLNQVGNVVELIKSDALNEAKENEENIKNETEKEIEIIDEHCKAEINNLKKEMVFSVRENIANNAIEKANRIILENITANDKLRINNEFLLELEKVL